MEEHCDQVRHLPQLSIDFALSMSRFREQMTACSPALDVRACRYLSAWNVFAVDLKNEPHDAATWGDGNPKTDWRLAAQRLGDAVLVRS